MFRQLPAGDTPTRVVDGTYFGNRTSHTVHWGWVRFEFLKFNLDKMWWRPTAQKKIDFFSLPGPTNGPF